MTRGVENPLDVPLLRALCALVGERSVTRAAIRLNLSQPATSLLLKRLRDIFSDQLLVRGRGGMVATDRAETLRANALTLLAGFDGLVGMPEKIDPADSRQTFTIALPDHILPALFTGIMGEFRRLAPKARLVWRGLSADYDFEGALAAGTADIVISSWPSPPPALRISVLFEDDFVSLVDQAHQFTRHPPTEAAYLAASHIAPPNYSQLHRGVVETYLASHRQQRDQRVIVSYFSMAPHLLVGTDLVFTVTRHFAEYYAGILPLKIITPPIDYPRLRFYQLWHERTQASPMHRWLRSLLATVRPVPT